MRAWAYELAAYENEIDLAHQLVAQPNVELLGGHRFEGAEVHVACRADDCIELPDRGEELAHALGVGSVDLKRTARTAGGHDFVPL